MEPLEKILAFLTEIGLEHKLEPIDEKTHLPGLIIRNGTLIIDTEKLLYPGDILHEAGHMACMPPETRAAMSDTDENKCKNLGNEIPAIAWSYAACLQAGVGLEVVFHPHGYKGQHEFLIRNYTGGGNQGIPLLQWLGMTYDPANAAARGEKPFPHMINWLCRINPYVNQETVTQ